MTDLEKQPRELLHMVLALLHRSDLSALSCVSKQLRDLVEPTLYREISWKQQDIKNRHPPVHLLLRSILNRAELASYINSLAFCFTKPYDIYDPFHSIWKQEGKPDIMDADVERIKSLIASFKFYNEHLWISNFKMGEVDLFIALLISQSTNLRRLQLDTNFQQGTAFIGDILEKAVAENSLCALEHVVYSSDITSFEDIGLQDTIDYRQIKILFSVPSLRSISMALPSRDISWPGPKVPVSGLKSLVLHHSQVSAEELGTLLVATPSLKSLTYETWINVDEALETTMQPWEYFDCTELSRSLAYVQQCLVELFISLHFLCTDVILYEDADDKTRFRGTTGWTLQSESYSKIQDLPGKVAALLPSSLVKIRLSDAEDLYGLVGPDDFSDDSIGHIVEAEDDGDYLDYESHYWEEYDYYSEPDYDETIMGEVLIYPGGY